MLTEKEQAWLFLREFTREILVSVDNNKSISRRTNRLRYLAKHLEATEETPAKKNIDAQINIHQSIYNGELNLGELNELLKDREIYAIECPGPNKFLLTKKPNKTDIIPVPLNEEEIKRIIEEFAGASKTRPSEGVFNSSYKNLEITAVISDFAGSRFAITRYLNPEELIEESKLDLN